MGSPSARILTRSSIEVLTRRMARGSDCTPFAALPADSHLVTIRKAVRVICSVQIRKGSRGLAKQPPGGSRRRATVAARISIPMRAPAIESSAVRGAVVVLVSGGSRPRTPLGKEVDVPR